MGFYKNSRSWLHLIASYRSPALQAGLDWTTISMLERRVHQPTLSTIFVLADTLDIKAATLIARVDKKRARVDG